MSGLLAAVAILLVGLVDAEVVAIVGNKNAGKSRLIDKLTGKKHNIGITPHIVESNIPSKGWFGFFGEESVPLFPIHEVNGRSASLPCVTAPNTVGCTFFSNRNGQLVAPKLANVKSTSQESLCLNLSSSALLSPCAAAPTYEDKTMLINNKKTRVLCTKSPRRCLTPRPLHSFSTKEMSVYCASGSSDKCYLDTPPLDACCENGCPNTISSLLQSGTASQGGQTFKVQKVLILGKVNCTSNVLSRLGAEPSVEVMFVNQNQVDQQSASDLESTIFPHHGSSLGGMKETAELLSGFRFSAKLWMYRAGDWVRSAHQIATTITGYLAVVASVTTVMSLAAIVITNYVGTDSPLAQRVSTAWKAANVRYEKSHYKKMVRKQRRSSPRRYSDRHHHPAHFDTNHQKVTFDDIASAALNLSEKLQEKHLQPSGRVPQLPYQRKASVDPGQSSQCPNCGTGLESNLGGKCSHTAPARKVTFAPIAAPVEAEATPLHKVTACVAVAFAAYRLSRYQKFKITATETANNILYLLKYPLVELGLVRSPEDKATFYQRLKGAATRIRDRWKEYVSSAMEAVSDTIGRIVPERFKNILEPYIDAFRRAHRLLKKYVYRRFHRAYSTASATFRKVFVAVAVVASGLVEKLCAFVYFLVRPPDPAETQLEFETVRYRLHKSGKRRDSIATNTDSEVSSVVDLSLWDYADPLNRKLRRSHHKMGCTSRLLQEVERNLQEVDDLQDSWLYDKSSREMKEHVIGLFQGFKRPAPPPKPTVPTQPCASTQTPSRFLPKPPPPQRYVRVLPPTVARKIKPYKEVGGLFGTVRRVSQFMGYLVWPWAFESRNNVKQQEEVQSDSDSDEPFIDPSATPSEPSLDPLMYTTRDPHGTFDDMNPPVELSPAAKRMARRRRPNPYAWAATNCDATSEFESTNDNDGDNDPDDFPPQNRFTQDTDGYNVSFLDMKFG